MDNRHQILIISRSGDAHATMVGEALIDAGVQVFVRTPQALIEESVLSIDNNNIDNKGDKLTFKTFDINDVKIVWLRKPSYFFSNNNAVSAYEHIKWNQKNLLLGTIYKILESNKHLIHCYQTAFISKNKYMQLISAYRVGFRTPLTYYLDNKELLKNFDVKINKKKWVIKPATEIIFEDEGEMLRYGVSSITSYEIQRETEMPLIFQEEILIKSEIKCAYINGSIFAVEVNVPYSYEDLNDVPYSDRIYKAVKIPSYIKNKCILLCENLGFIFATIDFLINNNEEWIFIEINENGQFLFLEDQCPELPILQTTINYFLTKLHIYKEKSYRPNNHITFKYYRKRTERQLQNQLNRKD